MRMKGIVALSKVGGSHIADIIEIKVTIQDHLDIVESTTGIIIDDLQVLPNNLIPR